MESKSITGEGSELPALHVRKGIGESSTEFENRCRRERERQLLTAISEINQLKSALSSPQQESAELFDPKFVVMVNGGQEWASSQTMDEAVTHADKAVRIGYGGVSIVKLEKRITKTDYVAPPVTAEGKDRG